MSRSYIKRVQLKTPQDERIEELELQNRVLQAEVTSLRAIQETDAARVAESEDCEECQNICALKQEVQDANCDALLAQNALKNEVCSEKWSRKFQCNGLGEELNLIRGMLSALLKERDYDLALANYNLAYCDALGAADCMAELRNQLIEAVENNETIDARCLAFVNRMIALTCG